MTEQRTLPDEPALQAWSRGHALAMLGALCVCALTRRTWPVAVLAVPSFSVLLVANRGALTPSGRLGLANLVTGVRLALVCALAAAGALGAISIVLLTACILTLDLLDGWLARSRGDASAFGARFDMETDALLVLVLTLRLSLLEGYGAWALSAGALRYAYVIGLWLAPGNGGEAPRSQFGRYSFFILMLGLIGGFLAHGRLGALSVAFGTLCVAWSFARSCYFSHSAS
jgi:phosphatidylglycerophosphate synthase